MWRNITTILGTRRADTAMLPQVSTMLLCLTVVFKWWLTSLMSSGTNRPWSLKAKLLTPRIILTIEANCGFPPGIEEQMWISVPLVPRIDEPIYVALLNCSSTEPACCASTWRWMNPIEWYGRINTIVCLLCVYSCQFHVHLNNNFLFIIQNNFPDLFLPVNLESGRTSFPCLRRRSFFSNIQSRLFLTDFCPRLFLTRSREFSYWTCLLLACIMDSVPKALGKGCDPPVISTRKNFLALVLLG